MSPTAEFVELGPTEAVEFHLPIVKEYGDKLNALCVRAIDLIVTLRRSPEHAIPEAVRLIDSYECLRPAVEKLMRRTASLLDHAVISDDLSLLLSLRQEELEANLRHTPTVLARLEAEFGAKKVRPLVEKSHFTPLRA